MKPSVARFLRALPWLVAAPFLLAASALLLALTDLLWLLVGKRVKLHDSMPSRSAASLVIPNWNGRDLLERFLPSWVAAIRNHPGSEIVIVDNGSTDGSAEWVAANYPEVRLLALPKNLGFGGGSNAGFSAAKNDIVVLLNSDMRVEPDFLAPLLDGFTGETVFSVSCQIFFSDPSKPREETGLTQGWWQDGTLRVGHRADPAVNRLFPCFYGGGGSCAFDRRKFLELGGFDELLAPFYLEDTDLGFLAWKRGWKVLYQPASVVWHEHRGTIGKRFTPEFIQSVLQKNFLLFTWKNIHSWRRLTGHFFFSTLGAIVDACSERASGRAPGYSAARGIARAFRQLPAAAASRWRTRSLSTIDDSEAFRRAQPAYFHDRFGSFETRPARPRVLFVSPYPICPPTHGGGLFMFNTIRELSRTADVHAIVMLDWPEERAANEELKQWCKSVELLVRTADRTPHLGSTLPNAVREFRKPEIEWLIERQTLLHQIDVIQLEYTPLVQYARQFRNIACVLFEHDIYFQSVASAIPFIPGSFERAKARFEYLSALRFELSRLPMCDEIQVCTEENRQYLTSFLPRLAPRIDAGLRAGIDTSLYPYPGGPRQPFTMLFLGSFRHTPNKVALEWFAKEVLPLIVAKVPAARILVAGAEPPQRHSFADPANAVDLLGFVDDVRPLFFSCALFVCPIRTGSGIRVKLLEAFSSGIPVVSTRLGAEGLARNDGEFCALADDAATFAAKAIELLLDPERAAGMAARARAEVEANWDACAITARLVEKYREILAGKRRATLPAAAPASSQSAPLRD